MDSADDNEVQNATSDAGTPPCGTPPPWMFDELFGKLPCGFFRFRMDNGGFDFVSSCLPRNLGMDDAGFRAACHNRFPDLIYPADRQRVMREIHAADRVHCEFRITAASGRPKWFYVIGSANADAAGTQWFYAVISTISPGNNMLHSIMAHLPAGVVIYDCAIPERPLFVSDQALEIYGLSPDAYQKICTGARPFVFFPPERTAWLLSAPGALHQAPQEFTFRQETPAGRSLRLRATCRLWRTDDGRTVCYATVADVTGQENAARTQAKQREIFQMLMDDTRAIIFEYDVEHDQMEFSMMVDGKRQMFTRTRYLTEFFRHTRTHPDYRDEFLRRFREARTCPTSDQFVYRADYDGKGSRWYRAHYKCVQDAEGTVFQIIGRSRDVTSEVEAARKLQLRADMDELSGVYNRAKTVELVNGRLGTEMPGVKHTLMLLDIDRFKQINDTCGHPAGDNVIRALCNILRTTFRQDDIIGRIGGDEFVVMTTTPENFELSKRAEVLQERVRGVSPGLGLEIRSSISIGIACGPRDGRDFQALFVKADKALYAAKRGGRDRWVIYHEGLETN